MIIADWIATLLAWLYDNIWSSYGGAIILLTLVIMTLLAPLTIRQTKSMLEMQRLQPEIKKLRAKHGNDRERMNQEMMALYQANKVNPLGGCLPILVQLPIFLFLFQVVRGLTRRLTETGLATGEAGYAAERLEVEFADRAFNPDFIDETTQLSQDLRSSTEMISFGIDLSQSASSALGESFITGLPYLLLVIGVGVSTWVQQKQIQGRQKGSEMNPQQQMIMKVLPFMLPIFSFSFPAALVLYWFASNLFRVGQQLFITKQVYGKHDADVEIVKPTADSKKEIETKTTRKSQGTKQGKGDSKSGSGGAHGSRSPLSTPPPKKRKKPPAAKSTSGKGAKPEPKERQERPASKRVTPKKNTKPEPEPSKRRRDRKKS